MSDEAFERKLIKLRKEYESANLDYVMAAKENEKIFKELKGKGFEHLDEAKQKVIELKSEIDSLSGVLNEKVSLIKEKLNKLRTY